LFQVGLRKEKDHVNKTRNSIFKAKEIWTNKKASKNPIATITKLFPY
jgi:hypothetical protein